MGELTRRSFHRRGATAVVLVSVALALLIVAPAGAWASSSSGVGRTIQVNPASAGFTGSATWNGINIQTASSTSSAFQIHFNGVVNILYNWTSGVGAAAYLINDARLQIFYFGFALATRDIVTTPGASSGSIVMNWTTGPLQYILEGSYLLTASLLATNGTTAWSQSFWVNVAAPFYILAILPIVLILIAIYEFYAVATVGKQAALKSQKKGGAASPPTTTPAVALAPSTASTPADSSATPPTTGTEAPGTPPTGGSS